MVKCPWENFLSAQTISVQNSTYVFLECNKRTPAKLQTHIAFQLASSTMATNSSATATSSLTVIQNLITQYTFTAILIVGTFSNLANILAFLQKALRSNACSWYFILVSLGHLVFLYFGCLTRIIVAWSGFDLNRTSIVYCRARIYFLTGSLLTARYFLCLISIDRWMVTSRQNALRRLSSTRIARWLALFGTSFCLASSAFFPIWYRIEGARGCIGATDTFYPLFFTIYNLIITVGPFVLMAVFSLLALNNLRQSQRRLTTGLTQTSAPATLGQQYQRKDLQFIKLSLVQVLLYILCNAFYGYNVTYAFATQSQVKTPEQATLESFLSTVGLNISYSYMAITFFVYTLVSSTFRRECSKGIRRLLRCEYV